MDEISVGTEESAGTIIWRCSVKKVFEKLSKIHRKMPVLEYLFNEVSSLETCNFIRK